METPYLECEASVQFRQESNLFFNWRNVVQENVLWYQNLGMNDVDRVGGKNASLGEMISNLANVGVQVPTGFATTSFAFNEFQLGITNLPTLSLLADIWILKGT